MRPKNFLTKQPDKHVPFESTLLKDDHEGIIPREAWDAVQEKLRARREDIEQGIKYHGGRTHFLYGKVFCGCCGSPMKMHTDISKKCTNCGKEIWPSPAPAVITLIHKGDEVLLVRGRNFRTDFYGLVAGFVETGETLEEAAKREALEETGIKIKNLRYFGSQPWPYPCGIMVGFNADYESGEIHLQEEEIAKGAWFKADNLPTIPEKLSIARMLLDDWLNSLKK